MKVRRIGISVSLSRFLAVFIVLTIPTVMLVYFVFVFFSDARPRAGKLMDECHEQARELGYNDPKYNGRGFFKVSECLVVDDDKIVNIWSK